MRNVTMNPIAQELNETIQGINIHVFEMLSAVGKQLFFPKGILSQSAEAKEKAHRFNATIGMATEKGHTMYLPSIMAMLTGLTPEEALTYAPSFGLPPLRQTWKEAIYQKNPSLAGKAVSLPIATNAITHGLGVVSDMWVDPGDVIILPDMMWGNYNMVFSVRKGARIVQFPMFDGEKRFNLQAFERCVRTASQERKKVIVLLNFPNNPTGYTVTPSEGDGIAGVLADLASSGQNVLAVTDDAYFGLFYDDSALKESIFTRLIGRHPRLVAIKLDGATKENFVWGLRVGFITYGVCADKDVGLMYDALEKKTAGAVRGSISNVSRLSQVLVHRSMQSQGYPVEKDEKLQIMRGRAQEVKRVLADPRYKEAWTVYPFNSGYFMCVRLKTGKAETLRRHLLDHYGVGVIALGDHDIRVAFSCVEEEDIQALFDIMLQAVKDLASR
jgi:aspartate/methionine/tyrosine aminotransferase